MNSPPATRSASRWAAAAIASLGLAAASQAGESDWEVEGRPLPEDRQQRPELDPQLPAYFPCPVAPQGALFGTAPAILPDLVKRWASAFEFLVPTVKVHVPPPYGSPLGARNHRLEQFLRGSGDFAFLTRAMSPTDRALFEVSHGYAPLTVPVAGGSFAHLGFVDPVVVVVNAANPVERLGPRELHRVFASSVPDSGRPLTWGDLGVTDWSDRPVTIVGGADWAGEASARGLVVRERLLGGDRLRSDLGAASGTEADVPTRVASDPGAIGFTGLGHVVRGLRPLPIADPGDEFVAPTFENVAGATYPLARTVDLILPTRSGRPLEPALAEYVRFLLSRDGQAIVLEQGVFLPLRAFQASAARAALGLVASQCAPDSPGPDEQP